MAILNNNPLIGSGGQQGYSINNSLRFRSSASAYLNRTPASAGNRKTWTWSGWVKRGTLGTGQTIFSAGYTTGTFDAYYMNFTTNNTLKCENVANGGGAGQIETSAVFRDPSAWYHIILAVDTTQATASNRAKLYVNGVQQTVTFISNFTLNADTQVNNTFTHTLGRNPPDGFGGAAWQYFDGYLADVNFIDGSAKTPSDFGETDTTTGVWKPKAYSGTYGTNGFYLKFSDIATTSGSNAGLGKDFSGNTNYFTTNNISVTSGTTYDAMTDSPTLTSATVANYCTLNPLRYGTGTSSTTTISDGNLKITCSSNAGSVVGTINIPSSGKWYWEAVVPTQTYNFMMVGVIKNQEALANLNAAVGLLSTGYAVYATNGQKYNNSATAAYMAAPAQNTVVTVAYDADTGSLYVGAGGSWANGSGSTNQTWSGAVAAYTGITGDISPAVSFDTGNCIVNFGQRPFTYTPPTGYKALNTYNLPTPTILQGNKYMDATLYTGTGSSLNVTGVNFQPDFVWIKERSGVADHGLYDAIRGVQKQLESNTTTDETTETTGLTAFNSNGFTVGALAQLNTNTDTYVAWGWKETATSGFDIVTYTGNGSNRTISHSLGVAPRMIIVKARTTASTDQGWAVYHASNTTAPETDYLLLNSSAATADLDTVWNDTVPTSSVFSVGTNALVNTNNDTYVAYCFAEISGFSRFGSYVGNGSADGPMVYCNFAPKFILLKSITTAGSNWWIYDTARSTFNAADSLLFPNLSNAEFSGGVAVDILSNGFKFRNFSNDGNKSGDTFIFMAFASNPFKSSNAR